MLTIYRYLETLKKEKQSKAKERIIRILNLASFWDNVFSNLLKTRFGLKQA